MNADIVTPRGFPVAQCKFSFSPLLVRESTVVSFSLTLPFFLLFFSATLVTTTANLRIMHPKENALFKQIFGAEIGVPEMHALE